MKKIKVCQLARIPCAGSGFELMNLINQYSSLYESRYILGAEYQKDNINIPHRVFPTDLMWTTQREECLRVIKEADIIHVHHDWFFEDIEALLIGKTVIITLYNLCNSTQYCETDFNIAYMARMKKYATILTVADQPLQIKMFSSFSTELVPLVKMLFNIPKRKQNTVPHIVFAPTNNDRRGIGKKMYHEVLDVIKKLELKYKNLFTFDLIEGIPYEQNLIRKQKCDILIDDVDAEYEKFHNTSIEAACFGAVALTNYCSPEYPFLKTDIHTLEETLTKLITTPTFLKEERERIVAWRENNYTPKVLLNKYELLYSKKLPTISKDLTVFIISGGFNPNLPYCIEALRKQTISFNLNIINDVYPMAQAFQHMIDKCTTPYYIQVDNDMVLTPTAIETMYNKMKDSNPNTAMLCFNLFDQHLGSEIQGVKIYRHDVFKKYPYNLNTMSCEMAQIKDMERDGFTYKIIRTVLGIHSPHWTNKLIFDRYYIFMQKGKWPLLPDILLEIYNKNPSSLNLFAFMGAMAGILTPNKMNRDKDFREENENYNTLIQYFKTDDDIIVESIKESVPFNHNLLIQKLVDNKIEFWYLGYTCLYMVQGNQHKIKHLEIGVRTEIIKDIIKQISTEINVVVSPHQQIKNWGIGQVPCPVVSYLNTRFGWDWKNIS